jgi:hypothetical protein
MRIGVVIFFVLIQWSGFGQGLGTVYTGDKELDSIRLAVKSQKTDRQTFQIRAFKMKLWSVALQQQGAHLNAYLPIDDGMRKIIFWNTLHQDGRPQQYSDKEIAQLSKVIDDGYEVLEKIQINTSSKVATVKKKQKKEKIAFNDWTHYKGNEALSGHNGSNGPTKGKNVWKFPVGLAWEASPVIDQDKV